MLTSTHALPRQCVCTGNPLWRPPRRQPWWVDGWSRLHAARRRTGHGTPRSGLSGRGAGPGRHTEPAADLGGACAPEVLTGPRFAGEGITLSGALSRTDRARSPKASAVAQQAGRPGSLVASCGGLLVGGWGCSIGRRQADAPDRRADAISRRSIEDGGLTWRITVGFLELCTTGGSGRSSVPAVPSPPPSSSIPRLSAALAAAAVTR